MKSLWGFDIGGGGVFNSDSNKMAKWTFSWKVPLGRQYFKFLPVYDHSRETNSGYSFFPISLGELLVKKSRLTANRASLFVVTWNITSCPKNVSFDLNSKYDPYAVIMASLS